ncbi:MAG: hypothetical protein IH853_14570 [Bacteroidetes bacterium]|nr:hypothetical protein [Bacteroidota bacterium]
MDPTGENEGLPQLSARTPEQTPVSIGVILLIAWLPEPYNLLELSGAVMTNGLFDGFLPAMSIAVALVLYLIAERRTQRLDF